MKFNKWTMTLVAVGAVSLGSVVQAEEGAQHQVLTALSSTTLSGYVDTSMIWKPGTGNGFIPGRAFDGGLTTVPAPGFPVGTKGLPGGLPAGKTFGTSQKLDGFNFNVAELTLAKPLDESQWSAGYTVNLLFGPDANGYNTSPIGGAPATGDFSVKDAYVTLRAPVGNGLDFKVGTFTTIVGYEVFESPNDPNYSRSFGWQLEPTQHTGVLAGYRVNDMVSVAFGVANTWSAGINARAARAVGTAAESEKTYMGSITFTAPDSAGFAKGATATFAAINGLGAGINNQHTTTLYGGVTTPTPVEGLSAGAAFDYRMDGPNVIAGKNGNNWAWATAGYVSYQCTEKLKVNGRFDYTDGADGTWFPSVLATGAIYNPALAGTHNNLCATTVTVDYSLWNNVITRAELRWDHSLNGDRPYSNSAGLPGNKNATTLALNVIYRF